MNACPIFIPASSVFRRLLVGILAVFALPIGSSGAIGPESGDSPAVPVFLVQGVMEMTGWPVQVLPPSQRELRFGVIGAAALESALARSLEGWSCAGRRVRVEPVGSKGLDAFHVVYVGWGSERVLPQNAPRGVLLLGEGEQFLEAGGMIAFVAEEGRVRFDVHVDRLDRSGFRVGAPLLQMARRVVRSTGPVR